MSDTVGNNFGWIGAVYYKIIQTQAGNKNYYTLLGYDENTIRSNKKVVEVLSFESGQPIFGGPYFNFSDNKTLNQNPRRLILEYKKNASPRLVYDKEQDMIIYEHLVPEQEGGDPKKKYTYVGDGDYEGLKWKAGKWIHIDKVFTQVTKEFDEPVPNPIRNANGDIDRSKLKNNGEDDDSEDDKTEKRTSKIKTPPNKIKVKKK
jgi:hypothetical protein